MRLAVKFFLAYSMVILVLAGIAAWSLNEVAKLSIADDPGVTVTGAEALRSAVSLREAVLVAKRVDMRSLVFSDPEYAAASSAGVMRITEDLRQLERLITSGEEKALLEKAVADFGSYQAAVGKARTLRSGGDIKGAEKLLLGEAQPLVDRVAADLERLAALTRDTLDQKQSEAAAALERARAGVETLRSRTWKAVITAMILAVAAALAGTAVIALRVTRSLRRLSDATRAVAAGEFHHPLSVDTRDEIGELAKSFNSMAARLREIDRMKETFYATVSHELRSPLNAMQEAARLLEARSSDPLTARQERLIAIFQKGTERLLRLVNEVVDLARIDAGMLAVEPRPFSVENAVKQAIGIFRAQAEQQRIALRPDLQPDAGEMLGDEDRIVQVLVNLVSNALRYTPPGGSVIVTLRHTAAHIEITVSDTGIGIPADLLPVIFERFRQAHANKGGAGLGLAIVKSLVEAHGGKVKVESHEGKGSQFTVTFPREGVFAAAAQDGRQDA